MKTGNLASDDQDQAVTPNRWRALWEVLMVAAKLGLTSFGGPTAHLG